MILSIKGFLYVTNEEIHALADFSYQDIPVDNLYDSSRIGQGNY